MAVDKKNREEQDLERYGVWVKAGPDEIKEHDSTSLELMDIEDSDQDEMLITEEEEKLLGELEESSLPDFDDFKDLDDSFDDPFEIDPSVDKNVSGDAESKELLHKIEEELSALRKEIRQLKDELTGLRVPAVSPEEEIRENGGFFDEEEDETIALTGDELDNILDSADMKEESVVTDSEDPVSIEPDKEPDEEAPVPEVPDLPGPDGEDEEELIDLSEDFTELSLDEVEDFDAEEIQDFDIPDLEDVQIEEIEGDPAISILSVEESDLDGDPETIEIDIPGMDESSDSVIQEEEPLVNIDDIETDFEEVTDFEDFGLEDSPASDGEAVEIPLEEEEEDLLLIPTEETVLTESFEDDAFDEGEIVEIDLTEVEDDVEILEEASDIEMEDISLDDFGVEESDVLAVSEEPFSENEEIQDDIEIIDFETDLADSIELDDSDGIEESSSENDEDIPELEEIDLDSELPEEVFEEINPDGDEDIPELEEIDLDSELPEEVFEETISNEPEDFEIEEIDLGDSGAGEIPVISLDEAIDEIEAVDEFSLDDDPEIEVIEDLEIDFGDEGDEVEVTLPDNDFNELPGTEDLDLDSLDALVTEEIVELPEPDNEEEILPEFTNSPESTAADLREKTKTALELSSLPGDLKEEIKEVLKYMDQLLESLPDDKIQEFARSEHFEVYKKIFEELGIND